MKTLTHRQQRMHALINIKGNAERFDYTGKLPASAKAKFWYKVAKQLGNAHDVY